MYGIDRLKIVMPLCHVKVVDDSVFISKHQNGSIINMTYQQNSPEYLSIKLDYENDQAVIEFTGKILGEKYTELIRLTNILRCAENINSMGFIIIEKNEILHADVLKCDFTIDVEVDDIPALKRYLQSNLRNYDEYVCHPQRNGNFIMEKNVSSAKCRERLTIYNKEKEMNLSRNKLFLDKYFNGVNPFSGICRFEINLYTMASIRKVLNINHSTVLQVLMSARSRNPIKDFLSAALANDSTRRFTQDLKEYIYDLILADNNDDIQQVFHAIKARVAKGTKVNRTIEPIRNRLATRDYTMNLFSREKILNLVTSDSKISTNDIIQYSSL